MKAKKLKKMPKFKTEDEEFKFWSNNDTTDYIDRSKARLAIFTGLKPSTKNISLRIP